MSLPHKAYVFDYARFEAELAPLLNQALADDDDTRLAQFIDRNLDALTWPWEPDPLPETWRDELEDEDVHSLGDLALTKYYDSGDDDGLAEEWSQIHAQLSEECQPALLGVPFGPEDNYFDPGKMGSYFQDPSHVRHSIALLSRLKLPGLERYLALLTKARDNGRGLYVTF